MAAGGEEALGHRLLLAGNQMTGFCPVNDGTKPLLMIMHENRPKIDRIVLT
jgi:hypothetical protein